MFLNARHCSTPSMWVLSLTHTFHINSTDYTVFLSLVCEWLLCLTVFETCWGGLHSTFQSVSSCCGLLCFKPADNGCPWLSSLWVAAVAGCVSSLLTMAVLGSPGSEWLLWFAVCQVCWQWLSLALQLVSGCCGLLCSKPADNGCPWLSSLWVAAVACCVSSMLTMPVLGSLVCGLLWCLAVLQTCWWCLSGIFRMWVAAYPFIFCSCW